MVYFFSNLMSFFLENRQSRFSHKVLIFPFLSPRAESSRR